MRPASLRTRLAGSYAVVVATGAATLLLAVRVLVPRLFDARMRGAGRGPGNPAAVASQHDAVVSALNVALAIALAASLAAGTVVAVLMARRVLRPIDALRAATRRIASGRYDTPVAAPTEPELAALAHDVNHLAAVLAETDQRRAALISDVAHEMRTPLATITGYLEGFTDGLVTPDEMTTTITTEIQRLHRLARDLSDVSRADEGRLHLDLTDTDLTGIATEIVDRFRPRFAAHEIHVDLHATAPTPVHADRERLVQAVTNLIGNALTYTPAGGSVTIDVGTRAGTAHLAVTDTGRGLSPEQLDHVFERFYRADHHDHTNGTGIGLTIARTIVRAHGGDLTASSPGLGRGARFDLTLPTT